MVRSGRLIGLVVDERDMYGMNDALLRSLKAKLNDKCSSLKHQMHCLQSSPNVSASRGLDLSSRIFLP